MGSIPHPPVYFMALCIPAKQVRIGGGEKTKAVLMQRERRPVPVPVIRRACVAIPVGIFTIGLVTACPWLFALAAIVAVVLFLTLRR